MRSGVFILAVSILPLGCSSESHPKAVATTQQVTEIEPLYEPAQASALAFSPPVAQNEAPLDLSREPRQAAAFVGFEDLIRSYIYVRTDDQWRADGTDSYERRAIVEKVGSTTR
jgi:hypothetical protein